MLKDHQDSLMALRAQLRDTEDQLRRSQRRKDEVKSEADGLRRQVVLQTELAEECVGGCVGG